MNEPIVQVNENLVCNGDFEERFECWARTGTVAIGTAYYDNTPIKHMKAPKGGGVTQDVTLPRDPDGKGAYWLSFLWESSFSQSGWVRVSQGETEHYRIELKPDGEAGQAQQREGFGSGPERRFSPTLHEVELTSDLSSSKPLRIEICSSTESSSPFGELWVTRVKIALKLAPLELQEITLDGMSFRPLSKMYLCQGASSGATFGSDALITPHVLGFVPVPDNPWRDTPVALSIDNNPQGSIVASPAWDIQQSLDLPWTLDCPLIDDQEYQFTLSLRNRYTAQAYEIPVSLGHHRLIFREVVEAAYYPLIEQTVRLGMQVASFYTGQPLAGLTVNWSTEQRVLAAAVTDEQGWAYFDYEAKAAGDFIIEASVVSLYYEQGVWTQTFDVLVLGEDPWAHLTVFENNEIRDWIDNSYPNRGATHSIDVMLAADSPLRGSDFYLHWHGDRHEQLGVVVSPPLETAVPMPIDDGGTASWTLNCEDRRDGIFELSLGCSKLLLPSPRKRMSLARNRIRIKEIRQAENSPVVEEHESAYLRLQVVHVTDEGDGEPVIGALVKWQTADGVVQSQTGSAGWGSLKFYTREPGTHKITAAVRAHESAEPHECEFSVTAIARSSWKDKVNITFDRGYIDNVLGLFCRRGQIHSLEVTALADSPLIGQEITLAWGVDGSDIGLAVSELGEPRILRADEPLVWTLSSEFATSRSSMFGLRLLTDSLEDRELLGRLLSPDIYDEFELVLDQMPSKRGQSLYPCIGAVHRYIFRTNALSPLVGTEMDLSWSGSSAEDLGIILDPPVRTSNFIDESGMTWTLDCSNSRGGGEFGLHFLTSADPTDVTRMHLGHNKLSIETVRESAVFPIVGQDPAWMWAKVRSDFSEDRMAQARTLWTVSGNTEEHVTDEEGWVRYAYEAAKEGNATVEVSVNSPYDNVTDTRSMEVCSLANDPWDRLLFSMDLSPAQPFGQDTGFARRKLTHKIDVNAPGDTFLSGRKVTLGMVGTGPEALGIRFAQPVLGLPRVFHGETGFTDYFTVDDQRNGSFGLFLACESLARWSPVNAMSVGEGAQVVKIAERSRVSQTLFWREAVSEQITIVSTISGRPMARMKVVWRAPDLGEVTTTTNFYGEARIRFVPKTPGAAQLTATVGDVQYSESISLPYFLHEPREIKELVSDDPSGYPGQEVSARVYVVSAITGNPLANVEVNWEFSGVDIAPTTTDSQGIANVVFRLSALQSGLLDAAVPGGLAGWEVSSILFTLKAHERMMTEISGSGSYPIDQSVPISFRIVSIPDGKPIVGQKVLWVLNSDPDGSSFSTEDGWVRKSYSSQGMVGYKTVRASVVDEQGAVLEEEVFRLQFFDSELP